MSEQVTERQFDSAFLVENPADPKTVPPMVNGCQYLIDGKLMQWEGKTYDVFSPIRRQGSDEPILIGKAPLQSGTEALAAVQAAAKAWDRGMGEWPRASVAHRIQCVQKFTAELQKRRDEIVKILMWEICKTYEQACSEVDRTIAYINDTITALKQVENSSSKFEVTGGVIAQIRRAPLGVILCLGPFNYPLNETYTLVIPGLIMGNTLVMKTPRVGNLCHMPTLAAFQSCFPPGVVNVVSGSGREMMSPIMSSGLLDCLGFIGTNAAADALQKAHPAPHRLRVCLGLDAKNPGFVLPSANLDVAVKECVLGSLSFNGQRCTALKLLFVHESIADAFLQKFSAAVDALKLGLPWDSDTKITPLPEPEKPNYLKNVISDALAKGARIVNGRGGQQDRTLVAPTVLYPVTPDMKCYNEEQFGPLVPIAKYNNVDEIYRYLQESKFGQQASVFGTDSAEIAGLIDVLVNQVARVNINTQCQRGPDSFPFTGRKDSAYGTLSVTDALRVFSIRSVVATKDTKDNQQIVSQIVKDNSSNFLRLDHIF
jgi:glyceraldehyde-3-phosphate dehydrogenase (NADP+)